MLCEECGTSKLSMLELLNERGAVMRRQPLTGAQRPKLFGCMSSGWPSSRSESSSVRALARFTAS